MRIIAMILVLVFIVLGVLLMIISIRSAQSVFLGLIDTFRQRLRFSLLIGFSACLLFDSLVMIVGLVDSGYSFSAEKLLGAFLISFALGLFVVLGVLVQFSVARLFRKGISKRIKKKSDEE